MRVKLKAPEGYKYTDTRNNREYVEVIVDEKEQDKFELVPAYDDQIVEM